MFFFYLLLRPSLVNLLLQHSWHLAASAHSANRGQLTPAADLPLAHLLAYYRDLVSILTISSRINLLQGYLYCQIHLYLARSRLRLPLGRSAMIDIIQPRYSYSCHLSGPPSHQSTRLRILDPDYKDPPLSTPAEYSTRSIICQPLCAYCLFGSQAIYDFSLNTNFKRSWMLWRIPTSWMATNAVTYYNLDILSLSVSFPIPSQW